MKAVVRIRLKDGVLDPQGMAVSHALKGLGYDGVDNVRIGKLIELDVSPDTDKARVEKMCDELLANPVIETYEVDIVE